MFENRGIPLSTPNAFYFEPLLAHFGKLMETYQSAKPDGGAITYAPELAEA